MSICPDVPTVPLCTAPVPVVPPNTGAYAVSVATPVPPPATGSPVQFVSVPLVGVPRIGVISVGEV